MPGERERGQIFPGKDSVLFKKVAKIKGIIQRENQYLVIFNFFMILYLFIQDVGFSWWYLLAVPGYLIWAWFDITYILPHETDWLQTKSTLFRELKKQLERK